MYNFSFRFPPMGMNYNRYSGGCQRRGPECGSPRTKDGPANQTAPRAHCPKPVREPECDKRKLPAVRCSASGDIILPNHTRQGDTYNVAAINLDTSNQCSFLISLNFSCNVCMTKASLHLRFQIFKQGICSEKAIPVGPGYHFSRGAVSTETNTITFSACDCDSSKSSHLNYSVYVEVMGGETIGTAVITNPILIAAITEL